MKGLLLFFLSCLALAEGDPRGRLLKGPGATRGYAPVLLDVGDQEGSRTRARTSAFAGATAALEPNRVYLYWYAPMQTWYQVLTRSDGTIPTKPLEFLRWATILKGSQLGSKSPEAKYVLNVDGTWKVTSKGDYEAYWQIQKPPRIRFVEYRTSSDFLASAEKKSLGKPGKGGEAPRLLDFSALKPDLKPTKNFNIPNRVYAVLHGEKKRWAFSLTDAYGNLTEPLEFLAPGTILMGGKIGAPDPFGRYRMEKNGAWAKTQDPEVIYTSFADDPTRLKRVRFVVSPPDKDTPFVVD